MNAIVHFRKCTLSDKELLDAVDAATDKMFQDGKLPSRHIPARPNEDYDLLVGELVMRFYQMTRSEGDTSETAQRVLDELHTEAVKSIRS